MFDLLFCFALDALLIEFNLCAVSACGHRRFGKHFKLRLDDLQASASASGALFNLPVQRDQHSRLEPVFEIGTVEPDALQRAASLAEGDFEDGHAPRAKEHGDLLQE